ncbi:MAG: ABC transporter permease [Candidatus Riflebacteria bacterium]|nr:ABC transporter permease [Candidatus Riflebacteria bacterium]
MRIPLAYNLRSLMVRKVTTLMTMLGIALVVATFVALMAMASGLDRTLRSSGVPENVIFLRKGAVADATSSLTIEQFRALSELPEIMTRPDVGTLASPELVCQLLWRRRDGGNGNVILRGVRPVAFAVRGDIRIEKGVTLQARSDHLVVGRRIPTRYPGFELGSKVQLFLREYTVVGIMSAAGGVYESEIWCDLDGLASDTRRSYYSAVVTKLKKASLFDDLSRRVDADPRIALEPRREVDYFDEQSESARRLRDLWMGIALLMGIGAALAAMNTMYAAIAARTKEIGTLRVLGFTRAEITASFIVEAVFLALPGGILGCLLAIPVDGWTMGTLNLRSMSDVTFSFTISVPIILGALILSILIGFLGGLLPACQGTSVPITRALREF